MQNDLISRSKLHRMLSSWDWQDLYLPIHFSDLIAEQKAVDVVPVVRCVECINYGYRNRHWDDICLKNEPKGCRKWLDKEGMFIIDNPNDFCSYGERKEQTHE